MSEPGKGPMRPPKLDWSRIRMKSRSDRAHKVAVSAMGKTPAAGCSFSDWLASLPEFLGVTELRRTVSAIVAARRAGRPVVLGFGGHVVKTGCSPVVIDLIQRGIVTAVATNGSGAIHDLELAETGNTSEEVGETIQDGTFGMVFETCQRMNEAACLGAQGGGLGQALGKLLAEGDTPYKELSLFVAAYQAGIPATVHVAVGTDTVHMYPEADGAALGAATMADFHTICDVVAEMGAATSSGAGGIWLNIGSAVILPEVFLKAVSVARNLGHSLSGMHTANFDMLQHYRPTQNIVRRPVADGHGHAVIGHHEIMLPLLRQAVIEALEA